MRPQLNAVQLTSLLTAFWRHCEFKSAVPLCQDPHASILLDELLPGSKRAEFQQSPLFNAGLDILACRTRRIDDWLLEGSRKGQTEQVVFLGAGMDTRPYRLDLGKGSRVFEVEKDVNVLRAKHETLKQAGIRPMVEAVLEVGADVTDTEELKCKLRAAGLRTDTPTSWVVEGLLEYLPLQVQGSLFAAMREGAGKEGSRVGMQVLDPTFASFVSSLNVPLPYQTLGPLDYTTDAVRRNGWEVKEVCDDTDFANMYGRRPHKGFRLVFGCSSKS